MPYSAYTMDPDSREAITLEWAPHLGEGETISSSSWPLTPSGITVVGSPTNTQTTTTITLENPEAGHEYYFVNRITTPQGRYDWNLKVASYEYLAIPAGPPYASIREHQVYTPASDGEEALKVEMVAADAADLVQRLAPTPPAVSTVLTLGMDASQSTVTLTDPYPEPLPERGELLVGTEILRYSEKDTLTSTLKGVLRGQYATTPAVHSAGDVATEVGYPIRARRAELAVFEWLFSSRGWRPSRSGVLGAETYLTGTEVYDIVRQVMGPYYGRKGGAVTKRVTMAPRHKYDRRSRMDPRSWQMGWYDI